MEQNVATTLGNEIVDLDGGHALLPIENRIGVVETKVRRVVPGTILPRMTEARTIRDPRHMIGGGVVNCIRFQGCKGVEERNNAAACIRLGGDGGLRWIALADRQA